MPSTPRTCAASALPAGTRSSLSCEPPLGVHNASMSHRIASLFLTLRPLRLVPPQWALLGWLALAACSPPNSASVEGVVCTNPGDEVCSLEAGFPRARCEMDGQWHILEKCAPATCNVQDNRAGNRTTWCSSGGTTSAPGKDAATGSKDSGSGPGPVSDSAGQPKATACLGYACDIGQACIGIDGCEDPGCAPCQAGQRCVAGACHDYCDGVCFESQHCGPGKDGDVLGQCAAMSCAAPLTATAAVATGIQWLTGAKASEACPGMSGAGATLLSSASFGWSPVQSQAEVQAGAAVVGFSDAPSKDAWLVGRRSGGCTPGQGCTLKVSRHDNLAVDKGSAQICGYRFPPGSALVPLPVRRAFERGTLGLSKATWTRGVNVDTGAPNAILCGAFDDVAMRALLSQSLGVAGMNLPTQAALAGVVKPDFSSSGGVLDMWSVVLRVELAADATVVWAP